MKTLIASMCVAVASGGALVWVKCGHSLQSFIAAVHAVSALLSVLVTCYKLLTWSEYTRFRKGG